MARPRYQHGYLFRRGNNWVLRYRETVLSSNGALGHRHRAVVLGRFRTKKEAQRAAEAFLRPHNQGAHQPQADMTLTDFWFNFFEPEMLPTLKISTRKLYRCLTRKHLLPYFGSQKMCDIARVHVQQFIGTKQRQGYSTETLGHFRDLLSKLLGTAVSWGWLPANPARGAKLPPMERRREPRVLSPDEVGKISKSLPEPARAIFLLGVTTGLRIGELIGLQVRDIDFSGRLLFVRRTVYRGDVGTPKTRGNERRIPLADFAVQMLRQYLEGRTVQSEWLFPSDAGTVLDDRNLIRRQVEPMCDRLGIPRFSWHSLRHTFSTMAGNIGVALPLLQSVLGHTSSETTAIYTHPLEAEKRLAVENVSRVLCSNVLDFEGTAVEPKPLIQ